MSYTFSFNVSPPIGFSIDPQTGLITIDADAAPFAGNLSVRVSDGVLIDIKSIPIALTAPTITPLLSSVSQASCRGGGRVEIRAVDVRPVACRGGGRVKFTVSDVPIVSMTVRGGGRVGARVDTVIQSVIEVGIRGDAYTLAIGDSTQLTAEVYTYDDNGDQTTTGINQDITWSIASGSAYGTVSPSGLVTATDGSFDYGDFVILVKATSVAYPAISTTYEFSAIAKFTGIQVTPSVTSVQSGDVISIASLLLGQGQNLNFANTSLITVYINDGFGNYLFGGNFTYTAGQAAGLITIRSTYYYPAGNYEVSGTATVQNSGTEIDATGLTIVPSYTVTHTGDANYADLTWAALNDNDGYTGSATGTYYSTSGDCSIVVDLGSPNLIKKIAIAGGYIYGSWGDYVAQYLNGGFLEYSNDGVGWTNYATIAGVTDSGYKQYDPNITARYWRIRRTLWCATTAFQIYT